MSLERNFGVFLGGQLIVGILYGVVVAFVMSLVSLPYAVTTACVCGALMLIPLFGGPLSLFAPLLVAVSESPGIALIVLPVLFVVQTVLLNVVLPKIVGQSSGLGPVATLFVLLAGAQVGGVWGVLLGVPIAGVVMNILEYLITNSSWGETSEVKVGLSVTAGADTDPAAQAEVTVREVEKLEKEEQVTRS
jgi:predicted PurR-regulated permease PerM